jgi:hypothetical protein
MNQALIILAVAVALIILYFYWISSPKGGIKGKQRTLWQECRQKLRLPTKVADETIERYINSLKKSHPNHPEEWYLEKIIYDLDRDHR